MRTTWFPARLICALGVLVAFAGGVSLAGEGRRPIAAPTTITESGSYVLTRDIVAAAPPVITITAPEVTLDLNGRSIRTTSPGSGGLVAMQTGSKRLRIINGRLSGASWCVYGGSVSAELVMDGIECTEANGGVAASGSLEVTRSRFSTYQTAISFSGGDIIMVGNELRHDTSQPQSYNACGVLLGGVRSASIRDNVIECFAYEGTALGVDGSGGIRIEHNTIAGGDTSQGINVQSGSVTIVDNTLSGFRYPLNLVGTSGNEVRNNHLSHCRSTGQALLVNGDYNVVSGNTIEDCHMGVVVSGSRNRIFENAVLGSWEIGMAVGGSRNLVRDNQVQSAVAGFTRGLSFGASSSGNVYQGNMLIGNPGGNLDDHGSGNLDAGGNLQ
jgi:parallel beta-helix repeat protein